MENLEAHSQLIDDRVSDVPVSILNPGGGSSILLVCEHASPHIPADLSHLGLTVEDRLSHIAWDPGANLVSARLSALLDAPLVTSNVSRLVYDCNRPPEAPDAMPARSEVIDVPGNRDISDEERAYRIQTYYRPFETAVLDTLKSIGPNAVLVTVHSFTPRYHGAERDVQLGILNDSDTRLTDAMLMHAQRHTDFLTLRNQPYGPEDGVTHTLKLHGIENSIPNVMLEIRNDLIATQPDAEAFADMLHGLLVASCETCGFDLAQRAA